MRAMVPERRAEGCKIPNSVAGVAKKPRLIVGNAPDLAELLHECRVAQAFHGAIALYAKTVLPSTGAMVKISQRWRYDHRQTRICGRR
jgi:hypothetical protein